MNVMKKTILLACLSGSLSTTLAAEEMPDFEAYIGAAKYFWDSERPLDDSNSLELGAELPVSDLISLEAWFSDFDSDIKNSGTEMEGNRYSLGGLYHFSEDSLRPFMSLGVSHQELEATTKSDESLAYIGAGVKKYFDNNIVLRGELLAMNSLDYEDTDVGARIAIGYAFGRSASKAYVESTPAKEKTSSTSEGLKSAEQKDNSDASLEPQAQPQVAPGAARQPSPQAVQVDSDSDGVLDHIDQCQNTDQAFKVDAKGCPVMLTQTVSIDMNVQFETNSAEISAASLPEIKEVADFMAQFEQTALTVEGHTDDRGRAAYNKSLSQKRADAVRQTLINTYKLDAQRVKAIGYGEQSPVADNSTAEGRAANRRVIGIVESTIQKAAVK
jgi:OmpA-OmpF porin, OOP family